MEKAVILKNVWKAKELISTVGKNVSEFTDTEIGNTLQEAYFLLDEIEEILTKNI